MMNIMDMDIMDIKEPTSDQCNKEEVVFENERSMARAIWYPQMGGYWGKCVVVLDKKWTDGGRYRFGGCFEAYIWHDGDFPFSEDAGNPAHIHHCNPKQFIEFGKKVLSWNDIGKVSNDELERKWKWTN